MVDPRKMCNQHLLGEHNELHMLVGTMNNHPHGEAIIEGLAERGMIEPQSIRARHDALVISMIHRQINHDSDLDSFSTGVRGSVDREQSRYELRDRCRACRKRLG